MSLPLTAVIIIVIFRNCDPKDTIFQANIMQIANDIVSTLCAKYTIFTVAEANQNSLSLIGSLGQFDGMFLGIKYYTITYDNCSVMSIVYCDPARYDALHRQ